MWLQSKLVFDLASHQRQHTSIFHVQAEATLYSFYFFMFLMHIWSVRRGAKHAANIYSYHLFGRVCPCHRLFLPNNTYWSPS